MVDFHGEWKNAPENAEETQNNQDVMNHCNQCPKSILPLPESEEDVQEDVQDTIPELYTDIIYEQEQHIKTLEDDTHQLEHKLDKLIKLLKNKKSSN